MKQLTAKLRGFFCRDNLKRIIKSWVSILLNSRLLLCLFIAWMITNGWSYVLLLIGTILKINWMQVVAGTYLGLLWIPFTPEKIITLMIAILLMRIFYPHDEKTLGALRVRIRAARQALKKGKNKSAT